MSAQSWNPKGPVMAWMLPVALLLVAGTQVYSAEAPSGLEARKNALSKPDVEIAKWITQLDSDEFKVRDQATQALTKAGLQALPAVLKATQSKQPEVRIRAFTVLFALSRSSDQPSASATLAAVKEMTRSHDRRRVAQAKKILERLHIRARQILLEHGARFVFPGHMHCSGSQFTDEHMVHLKDLTNLEALSLVSTNVTDAGLEHLKGLKNLQILSLFKSKVTDTGLEHLKGLKSLQYLVLRDTNVTDAGLEHLKGLKSLQALSLVATDVTDDGIKKLQQALPQCQIYKNLTGEN